MYVLGRLLMETYFKCTISKYVRLAVRTNSSPPGWRTSTLLYGLGSAESLCCCFFPNPKNRKAAVSTELSISHFTETTKNFFIFV